MHDQGHLSLFDRAGACFPTYTVLYVPIDEHFPACFHAHTHTHTHTHTHKYVGRGEPIRLAFYVGGIDFDDVRITGPEFAEAKEAGAYPFGQLPVLEVDGGCGCVWVGVCVYLCKPLFLCLFFHLIIITYIHTHTHTQASPSLSLRHSCVMLAKRQGFTLRMMI